MAKRPHPEDEQSDLARRAMSARMRRRVAWVTIVGFALLFGVIAALNFTGHAALVLSTWGQIITAVYAVALFAYAFVMMSRYFVPPSARVDLGAMRGGIDVYQRRWRWYVLFLVVLMLLGFAPLPLVFQIFAASPFMRAVVVFVVFALTIALVFLLLAGPRSQGTSPWGAPEIHNDEFVAALRARTTQFAYMVTMLLLCGVLVVALWWPDLTLTALCWALYAGFAIPALYYVIADWRAASAHEERDV